MLVLIIILSVIIIGLALCVILLIRRENKHQLQQKAQRERAGKALLDTFSSQPTPSALFDTAFLSLYPSFVEDFNALLREDARETAPEGRLTKPQRIYALIRLGLEDGKTIASILGYSLSTVYNYKVSVKNAALGDREAFDAQVKQIGD